jgi:hypothetical protein
MLHNNAATTRDSAPRRSRRYDRKQRLHTLARLDQRTVAAKRIAALESMWTKQLGGKLTDGQRLAIERAAGLVALSEDARARRLAGDTSISLGDTVKLDNVARRAIEALGLPAERKNGHKSSWSLEPL